MKLLEKLSGLFLFLMLTYSKNKLTLKRGGAIDDNNNKKN